MKPLTAEHIIAEIRNATTFGLAALERHGLDPDGRQRRALMRLVELANAIERRGVA